MYTAGRSLGMYKTVLKSTLFKMALISVTGLVYIEDFTPSLVSVLRRAS